MGYGTNVVTYTTVEASSDDKTASTLIQCLGHEDDLLDCAHEGWFKHSTTDGLVSLKCFGGMSDYHSVVHVYHNTYYTFSFTLYSCTCHV